MALPPATAVARIDFGTGLDGEVRKAAERTPVWMGPRCKVAVQGGTPFWRQDGLAGAAVSRVGPLHELHDMSGPGVLPAAIFGFASPPPGAPAPSRAAVLQQLVQLFGPKAADAEEVVIKDWRVEQFTSPPGVERIEDYGMFGHRLFQKASMQGRLHWAATETSVVAAGHIEGALAASDRAVDAVLAS